MGLFTDTHKSIPTEDLHINLSASSYLEDDYDFVEFDISKGHENISRGIHFHFKFRKKYVKDLIAALQDIADKKPDKKENKK